MGGCMSKGDEDSRLNSDSIERGLDEDSKRLKRECKILLLGLSLYSTLLVLVLYSNLLQVQESLVRALSSSR